MSSDDNTRLLAALSHLDRGDWQSAHEVVQHVDSSAGCWLHGIVHVLEGDLGNARYWYGRAKRTFSVDTVAELAAAKQSLAQPA